MRNNNQKCRALIPENFFTSISKFILISVIFLFVSVIVHGQSTTVFVDNFDRGSSSTFPGPGGTPVVNWTSFSTLDPPANIVTWGTTGSYSGDRVLQIFGTNTTANTGTPGRSYVVGPLADFHPLFKSTLNQNVADVTWTFSIRSNRTTLNNFDIGNSNYAPAVVLVSSDADFLSENANGYAVVLTRASSGNGIYKIVKFNNGLISNDNLTPILESSAGLVQSANYASVKVVYAPTTNTWSLSVRDEGGIIPSDPMIDENYSFVGSAIDDSFTNIPMLSCGFFYNHGISTTNSNAKAMWDNFGVQVAADALSVDASLSDLSVSLDAENYATLMMFDPATKNYQYYLTKNHALPLVNAIENDENATVDIVQAVNLRGTAEERKATVTVTAEDTNVTNVYTIEFIETEYIYLTGLGNNGGGGQPSNAPEGWTHGGSIYYTNTTPNGNNKYEGLAAFRCGNAATYSWFSLPIMKGIGTLSFYARKVDLNVVGNIKIYVQDKGDEVWTEVSDLGDIYNIDYQEFTVPINRQATDSMYVKVEITKNGDEFASPGYYVDDVAYTAYPGPGTDFSPELSSDFRIRNIQSGFAIDVENAKVEIYNSIGVLQQSALIRGSQQFTMNNQGMYIIRISTANGQTSTKLLVR